MTLPAYLWAAGAESVGLSEPKIDRLRCTNPSCRRWTRIPAFYPLDRALCAACHRPLVEKARGWAATLTDDERRKP